MFKNDFRKQATQHEDIFRYILTDLLINRDFRKGGEYIPDTLNPEESIEILCQNQIPGVFRIDDFVIQGSTALISFSKTSPFAGGGVTLAYKIDMAYPQYMGLRNRFRC